MQKIALEEHFLDPAQDAYFQALTGGRDLLDTPATRHIMSKMKDVDAARVADMDKLGIELAILSYYNGGSVQLDPDTQRAVAMAQRMNDFLGERTSAHAGRLAGWAALPVQAPEAAASELRRCVADFGFKGAMINGHTHGEHLDLPKFLPIWEAAAELDVPIYLHPCTQSADRIKTYEDYPGLAGPAWGWSVETGLHALRIICSGVFDRFPTLTLILGHMGELIPFHFGRFDQVAEILRLQKQAPKLPITHYIRNNVMITTSGNVTPATLIGASLAMGADRILFATDYPVARAEEIAEMIENAPLSEGDITKILYSNARKLFHI
jgi:2,3-dihydroxybenzoate decarboxylase